MSIRNPQSAFRHRQRRGFTLIEAALTTVIISTGVLAILSAQQAFHRKNDWSQRIGTGMQLANELREMTMVLPLNDPITGSANLGPEETELTVADFDDLDDFAGVVAESGYGAGVTFDPPINALRQPIANMPGWSQKIEVANVLPDNISATTTQPLGTTEMVRVKVTVYYQSPQDAAKEIEPRVITTLSWVIGEEE